MHVTALEIAIQLILKLPEDIIVHLTASTKLAVVKPQTVIKKQLDIDA